jgi:hypothetical protein
VNLAARGSGREGSCESETRASRESPHRRHRPLCSRGLTGAEERSSWRSSSSGESVTVGAPWTRIS